jgi:hypothetical protein
VTVVVTFFESSPLFFVRTVSSNEKLSTTPLTETLCPDSNTSPAADKSAPATLTAPAAEPTSRAPVQRRVAKAAGQNRRVTEGLGGGIQE